MEYTVTDPALEPEIPRGVTVVCSETRTPRTGDFVVYEPFSGSPVFRRYVERKDGKILLQALNSACDTYVALRSEMLRRGRLLVILEYRRIFYPAPPDGVLRLSGRSSAPPESGDELLSFGEAMKLLKIKRTSMYALLQSGRLRGVKVGRLWRIERSALASYLRGGPE